MMNQFLRKTICLMLSLAVLLGCASAVATQEQQSMSFLEAGDDEDYLDEKEYPLSNAALGDSLYVLTPNALLKWKPGMGEPERLLTFNASVEAKTAEGTTSTAATDVAAQTETPADTKAKPASPQDNDALDPASLAADPAATLGKLITSGYVALFSDEKSLYLFFGNSGAVVKLLEDNGPLAPVVQCTLDLQGFARKEENYTAIPQVMDVVAIAGTLYIQAIDYEAGDAASLIRWDLQTGKQGKVLKDKNILSLCPYKDGQLLCMILNNEEFSKAGVTPVIHLEALDPATDAFTPVTDLDHFNYTGINYNPQTNTAYFFSNTTAFALPNMQAPIKKSAYFNVSAWDGTACGMLAGGYYYIATYDGVFVRKLDLPGAENGALTIYGSYDGEAHRSFGRKYPQIPTILSQSYFQNLEAFTNAMVSGQDTVDVLMLTTSYAPFAKLMDKGYAMDLSGNADIVAAADGMYASLLEACKKDGKLYALPQGLFIETLGCFQSTLEELELTQEDMPKSWLELLDFLANWQADYGDDNPSIGLFDSPEIKNSLLNALMRNFIAYSKKTTGKINFEDPLFAKLMAAFDAIDFTDFDQKAETQEDYDEIWNRSNLFSVGRSFFFRGGRTEGATQEMVLSLDAGLEPVLPAELTLMFINPKTTRPDQALLYVANTAQNYEPAYENVILFPDHNDPVPNRYHERNLANYQNELEDCKKMLEAADPENRAELENNIESLEEAVAQEQNNKFSVTAEEIANYRENIAPYLYVAGQTPMTTWDDQGKNDLYTTMQQYMEGAIPVDRFIKEISGRIRLMELEDQ